MPVAGVDEFGHLSPVGVVVEDQTEPAVWPVVGRHVEPRVLDQRGPLGLVGDEQDRLVVPDLAALESAAVLGEHLAAPERRTPVRDDLGGVGQRERDLAHADQHRVGVVEHDRMRHTRRIVRCSTDAQPFGTGLAGSDKRRPPWKTWCTGTTSL